MCYFLFPIPPTYPLLSQEQQQLFFHQILYQENHLNHLKLIYKHLNEFDKGIFVGVGGSFDVLSGTKKRAPEFFIQHNLEWLYRITKEPSRLKRFYNNNIKFLFNVNKEKKCLK